MATGPITEKQLSFIDKLLQTVRIQPGRNAFRDAVACSLPGCKATDPEQLTKGQASKVIEQLKAWQPAKRNGDTQNQSSDPNAATPKQKACIRRAIDRGEWFDAFDGAMPQPTDDEIEKMTKKEASSIIDTLKS